MAFHEIQFPSNVSIGTRGGPGFRTTIIEADSGSSERIARWSSARRKYNARYGIRTLKQLQDVLVFYLARGGPVNGFRFKDWLDFTTATDHRSAPSSTDQVTNPSTISGSLLTYQIQKTYVSGSQSVVRTITKPVAGTVSVALNGGTVSPSNYTVNTTTGVITFNSTQTNGAAVTAGCEFDVPVQFGAELDDVLQASIDNFDSGDIPDIPLTEILGDVSSPERFYYGGSSVINPLSGETRQINFGMGRVLIFLGGNSATMIMPNPSGLETGGPYHHIIEGGSGRTVTFVRHDNFSTLFTLGSGITSGISFVYISGSTNFWGFLTNG